MFWGYHYGVCTAGSSLKLQLLVQIWLVAHKTKFRGRNMSKIDLEALFWTYGATRNEWRVLGVAYFRFGTIELVRSGL